jgi:DNA-binding MarR family transcriptional regulator
MAKEHDVVERIIGQWNRERPDVDVSPLEVIGRISRLSHLIDAVLAENFARHGIEAWMFDVMATLRRSGEPYELSAGALVKQTMVTTGAMTNRIDRMEQRGFVERVAAEDRRKVIVRLTEQGLRLADEVVVTHMETEQGILESLSARQRADAARLLKATLIHLGDSAELDTR